MRPVQVHREEPPSLWAAIESIASTVGCVPRALLDWAKREEIQTGMRESLRMAEAQHLKDLERETKEPHLADEILMLASAFFAQPELDRRLK